MPRALLISIVLFALGFESRGQGLDAVVADASTRVPLPGASVFDRNGRLIGVCRSDGRLPYVEPGEYPVAVRCMGYEEATVRAGDTDTVFLREKVFALPEFVFESRGMRVLHMLAYVREYSTLSSYTDTVFLFREKMVDFMLPSDSRSRFKGWKNPRVLASKSYYRFTDAQGLDSVSDRYGNHFSWADWVGVGPEVKVPPGIRDCEKGIDTIPGRYAASEVWTKHGDRLTLDVDVLADSAGRRRVPNLSVFFRRDVDFERFRVRFNYDNAVADSVVGPVDMSGYSFNIESRGRAHGMFMFNRVDEPFFVTTYGEVYFIDKEYISVKEARSRERNGGGDALLPIYEPAEAPALQPYVLRLIDRVNSTDHESVRLAFTPDERLAGRRVATPHFGQRLLQLIKTATGISDMRARRKWNRQWREFRNETQKHKRSKKKETSRKD